MALIGNPTKAAEPVTKQLLFEYSSFLGTERWRLAREIYGANTDAVRQEVDSTWVYGNAHNWSVDSAKPSTRAAVMLATAGIDWRLPIR